MVALDQPAPKQKPDAMANTFRLLRFIFGSLKQKYIYLFFFLLLLSFLVCMFYAKTKVLLFLYLLPDFMYIFLALLKQCECRFHVAFFGCF